MKEFQQICFVLTYHKLKYSPTCRVGILFSISRAQSDDYIFHLSGEMHGMRLHNCIWQPLMFSNEDRVKEVTKNMYKTV